MTILTKPIVRLSNTELDGRHGPDRGRRIVASFIPGSGSRPDMIVLRPHGTRRPEVINVDDAYDIALSKRADREWALRMAERKSKKAARLARARQDRAERRLVIEARREAAA